MKRRKRPEFEAIHLVALGIDEVNKRGTPEHAKALETLEAGRKLWLSQHEQRINRKCPHCGMELP